MQQNSKKSGFTLVELLAVVVILGIIMMISIPAVTRWIDRSKSESKESMKQTLVMATQSYAQANRNILPKVIGQTVTVSAENLKDNQYLKEELQDANKKSCMSSYVKVYKSDKNKYTYTPYLMCEGDTATAENASVTPSISIGFSGSKSGSNIQNVATSSFKVTISGGRKDGKDLGIDGYSYSISVKYTSDTNEKSVEIYNSGSLNGGGKPSVVLEKSLEEYTDITKVNEFIVTVKAYNSDGRYKEQTTSSLYKDTTPPTCGEIEGQAAADSWIKQKGKSRTISVLCSDNEDGSGCVKEKFTKTFDTEMEYGTIQISDNAGNTTDCRVRVHIDWTKPTIKMDAYPVSSTGGKGSPLVGTVTANHSNSNVTLNSYSNQYGNNRWLNRTYYQYGIAFEVTVTDNIHINTGQWFYNNSGINQFNAPNLLTMNTGSSKSFTATDNTTLLTLKADGIRRARYEIIDKANNKTIINIEANLDKTRPGCVSSGGSATWTNGNRTLTGTCSDAISGCTQHITKAYTEDFSSTTETPGTVYDYANNSITCPANQIVRIDKTPPTCSTSKSHQNTPDGVTVQVSCNDGLSGLASCPCSYNTHSGTCTKDTGLKVGKTYQVKDVAGNTNSCTVSVEEYTAWAKRTRSCSKYNSCQNSACGTCGGICRGLPQWNGYQHSCEMAGWDYIDEYTCSCETSACGCKNYSAWSGWSGYSRSSCSSDNYTDCTSRLQYQ